MFDLAYDNSPNLYTITQKYHTPILASLLHWYILTIDHTHWFTGHLSGRWDPLLLLFCVFCPIYKRRWWPCCCQPWQMVVCVCAARVLLFPSSLFPSKDSEAARSIPCHCFSSTFNQSQAGAGGTGLVQLSFTYCRCTRTVSVKYVKTDYHTSVLALFVCGGTMGFIWVLWKLAGGCVNSGCVV